MDTLSAISIEEIYAVLPWIGVLLVCTLVLVAAFAGFGFLSLKRKPKGWLRLLSILDLAGAAGCGAAAWAAYGAYLQLLPSNLPRSYPLGYGEEYFQKVSAAVDMYMTIGLIAAAITVALLIVSTLVAARGRMDRSARRSAAAHEEQPAPERKV